jgi:hypothetical protein
MRKASVIVSNIIPILCGAYVCVPLCKCQTCRHISRGLEDYVRLHIWYCLYVFVTSLMSDILLVIFAGRLMFRECSEQVDELTRKKKINTRALEKLDAKVQEERELRGRRLARDSTL